MGPVLNVYENIILSIELGGNILFLNVPHMV